MIFRSLKSHLHLILLAISLQLILVISAIYTHSKLVEIQNQQNLFTEHVNLFLENLALEKEIENSAKSPAFLNLQYQRLIESIESHHQQIETSFLTKRTNYNRDLYKYLTQRHQIYKQLNEIMPSMAKSVSYIHEHHLAYLQNLINRKGFQQDNDDDDQRSTGHISEPTTELKIIEIAINIQNSMLEIIEIFSRLRRQVSPENIINDFTTSIHAFYAVTNAFEELSLDAQDGLLIEELIISGITFENSFNDLLKLEQSIEQTQIALNKNKINFLDHLHKVKTEKVLFFDSLNNRTLSIITTAFCLSVVMILIVLLITKKVITALTTTLRETNKIQENLSYAIPLHTTDFREFTFIYKTLNRMSETIGKKIYELSQVQIRLEQQVKTRTEELSQANLQLQEEIDERIKNEKQRIKLEEKLSRAEKMEALGTLAGGVAHDLNNLLSGVVTYPEILLLDLPQKSPLRIPLETIQTTGSQVAVIVQDLLTMARRGVAKQEVLDLNTAVKSFLNSPECKNISNHHPEVSITHELEAEIATINGSKVHLQKSLTNLITNGAESISGKGAIHISTSNTYIDTVFKSYDQVIEGEYIKVSVKDDGLGISEEHLDSIFEPFFTTKTMGRSGSGLGMAVVWGTVKDHGGYIDIESKMMVGTTFDLYFPLIRNSTEFLVEDTSLDRLYSKGETVLVVDDVKEQREIASLMLTRLGYIVETVDSGETAIDYLRYQPADILVLDMIMLPGIDGLETYRRIIKSHPEQKAIIVSGFSETDKVQEAQKLGTGPYVKKPYSMRDIASVLRHELDR